MRLYTAKKAGSACPWSRRRAKAISLIIACALGGPAVADIYSYQDELGQRVFTDRQPGDARTYERTPVETPLSPKEDLRIWNRDDDSGALLMARNESIFPIEVGVQLHSKTNIGTATGRDFARAVLQAGETAQLMAIRPLQADLPWSYKFRSGYVPGDPKALHDDRVLYRPPFAPAHEYFVTQAPPDRSTHTTPDSQFAIDIAMPEGAGVFSARGGMVVAVAYSSFRGGLDRDRYADQANIVRILHDDGSFAVYAHLSWESIRVRPGQRVATGEYIAAAGSTGYSSGPHLHFAVQRNAGMELISVPVRFNDGYGNPVVPSTRGVLRNP